MEFWIDFGRGPLFRLAFVLMVLGLFRIFLLTVVEIAEAYRRNADRIINWREVAIQTVEWLIPVRRLWRQRPVYSSVSFLFHVGLLVVPLFLTAHVLLWKRTVGVSWPAVPQALADVLTLVVVVCGVALFIGRVWHQAARRLSRSQDYLWPLVLVVPFATGYACSNLALGPNAYDVLMLLHVYMADLILLLIPFTKIAHCVLAPLSQVVSAVAWKFPVGAGDRVAATLGYAERPTWVEKARLRQSGSASATATGIEPEVCSK